MLKKITFRIDGTHCSACATLIETEVDSLPGVKSINVDHVNGRTEVEFDDQKIGQKEIFKEIERLNYKPRTEQGSVPGSQQGSDRRGLSPSTFAFLIIAGLMLFTGGYIVFKYYDGFAILAKLNEPSVSYPLILLIGFLVSFHCIGMCGGLIVAYSAGSAAGNKRRGQADFTWPHLQYNLGRFVSYTVIGGLLGGIGSFFAINPNFSGFVMLLAGLFMLVMALSLFTKFKWLEKLNFRMPQFMARFLYNQKYSHRPRGPLLIGLLNGFMPCGPLQAMQLYALGTGSFTQGAVSMGIYALGTVPLMFGFGAFISTLSHRYIGRVMKISAVIVAVLGLIMINRGLINFGYGYSGFISSKVVGQTEYAVTGYIEEYQTINMDLTYSGYSPNVLYIKKDVPVRWVINVKQMTGCTDAIMIESLDIYRDLQPGENIIEFIPPSSASEIKFSCWMRMVWGKFIITDSGDSPPQDQVQTEALNSSQGTCGCGGSCGGTCGSPTCGCSRMYNN